jgi:hypothetical protein
MKSSSFFLQRLFLRLHPLRLYPLRFLLSASILLSFSGILLLSLFCPLRFSSSLSSAQSRLSTLSAGVSSALSLSSFDRVVSGCAHSLAQRSCYGERFGRPKRTLTMRIRSEWTEADKQQQDIEMLVEQLERMVEEEKTVLLAADVDSAGASGSRSGHFGAAEKDADTAVTATVEDCTVRPSASAPDLSALETQHFLIVCCSCSIVCAICSSLVLFTCRHCVCISHHSIFDRCPRYRPQLPYGMHRRQKRKKRKTRSIWRSAHHHRIGKKEACPPVPQRLFQEREAASALSHLPLHLPQVLPLSLPRPLHLPQRYRPSPLLRLPRPRRQQRNPAKREWNPMTQR